MAAVPFAAVAVPTTGVPPTLMLYWIPDTPIAEKPPDEIQTEAGG